MALACAERRGGRFRPVQGTRYVITGTVPGMGRVQHIIRARNPKEAKRKFLRAHPLAEAVERAA